MSLILFDIFLNDLYRRPDVSRRRRVEVPGVDVGKKGKVPGLLLADDLVALSKNCLGAQRQAGIISDWCHRWEMKI